MIQMKKCWPHPRNDLLRSAEPTLNATKSFNKRLLRYYAEATPTAYLSPSRPCYEYDNRFVEQKDSNLI